MTWADPSTPARVFEFAPARAHVEEDGDRLTFAIQGELDLSNVSWLREVMHGHIDRNHQQIVLELSAVDYLDSASLSMVIQLGEALRARRQELVLVAPAESAARRLLMLSGVAQAFTLQPRP
jgi:anti-anti-sigma factor